MCIRDSGGGLKNDYSPKTIARHEVLCNLDDVIRSAARLLKTSGRFYMVHRPHRLVDIICKLREYKLCLLYTSPSITASTTSSELGFIIISPF